MSSEGEPSSSSYGSESESKSGSDEGVGPAASSSQGSTGPIPPTFKFSQTVAQTEIVNIMIHEFLPLTFASSHACARAFNRAYNPVARSISPYLFNYSHSFAVTEMAKFACSTSLPLHFAASDVFENAVKRGFNPEARKISQKELVREIRKLVTETRSVLINNFANFSNKVSISCDVWTASEEYYFQLNLYLGITCHWIDDDWVLQKRFIAYRLFDVEKNATNISRMVRASLKKYGLVTKVFSLSFDNASANTANFESLVNTCQRSIGASFFHVRCMSSVLNACVEDALNAFKEEVAPIREALAFIFDDSSRTKRWVRFCKRNGLTTRIFHLDDPDCWDLTYKMLSDSYQYRDALCSFLAKQKREIVLFANQWDACSNLCLILKTFKEVVIELSRVYYPTSVLVVDNCVKIAVLFNSLIGCDGLGACISEMMVKWLKYFHEIPNVFLVAKLLDPKIRLDGLEELLGFYYDALFPIKDEKTPIPSVVVAKAKECLYDIFLEYRLKYYSNNVDMDISASSSDFEESLSVKVQKFYDKRSGKDRRSYGSNPCKELESYFASDFEYLETESFDILKWWSRMSTIFPILSLIAKDILAVPASTASLDQAFGEEGYTIDGYRSRLPPWILQDYVLLGDWVNAETRNQEIDFDDATEDDANAYDDVNTDDDDDDDDDDHLN